jgi:hypothetical protein
MYTLIALLPNNERQLSTISQLRRKEEDLKGSNYATLK